MSSPTDREQWTIISDAMATDENTQIETGAPFNEPKIEAKPNTDAPAATEKKDDNPSIPPLERNNTWDSFVDDDIDVVPRSRPRRRNPIRRYSPSPIGRNRVHPIAIDAAVPLVASSTKLISYVGNHDGVADLPFPARSSVYLTTYPFTDRDLKKFAWLFAQGVEDTYLNEPRGITEYDEYGAYPVMVHPHRRSRSPYYDAINEEIPTVFLSKALDTGVIPEDGDGQDVRYWIVVKSRFRGNGTKLVVADSRKAAGILTFYEALNGNSILFVGAIVGERKKGMKVKKVENLKDAIALQSEEGFIGIVC